MGLHGLLHGQLCLLRERECAAEHVELYASLSYERLISI
jgi:hypothetical protein